VKLKKIPCFRAKQENSEARACPRECHLLIVIAILLIVVGFLGYYVVIGCVFKANFWFTEDGVLRELKVDRPLVTKILKTERHPIDKSVIVVEEDGQRYKYCLDSSVLFNYEFSECDN